MRNINLDVILKVISLFLADVIAHSLLYAYWHTMIFWSFKVRFPFVTTIFKSVISVKKNTLVVTLIRWRSAWNISIGIALGKASLLCLFPAFYQVQQTTTFCARWADSSCPHCPDVLLPVAATESFISTNFPLGVLGKFIFSSSAWYWSSK